MQDYNIPNADLVIPGDEITSEEGFMNGHGTHREGQTIHSSLLGRVNVTNKLIMVSALRSRYSPQIGDVVVGQVTEISNKRWKVELEGAAAAYLSLNATYLPEQRKKNEQDEFNMRKILREGDIVVAEVHSVQQDGSYSLHTRNPKYGRLEPGCLIQVPSRLIRRQKHHILVISGVGIILANNGAIYLSDVNRTEAKELLGHKLYSVQHLTTLTLLANLIRLLSHEQLEISEPLLKELLQDALTKAVSPKSVLDLNGVVRQQLVDQVRKRAESRLNGMIN